MNNMRALYAVAILASIILLVHIIPSAEAKNSEARKQAKAQSEAISKGIKANADLRTSSSGSKGAVENKPIFGSTERYPPVQKSPSNTGVNPSTGKCYSNYGWLSVSLPNRWYQALIWIDGNYAGNKQARMQVVSGYHTVYVQYYGSSGFSYDETTKGYVPACKSWSINSS